MKNIVPDYRLDMVGEPCPYPAVATLEAMPQLKKGEILEVVSDCPQSINNIPLDARNHGWICPYISRHLLSLNPLLACCRRYSRGER
ncbi:sulfurtransferase-like selenium metabolism protein YedF [Salmonella enterica]|nr:sulfurtransferase-like selenium metabolism protein YedF [Salmonella enterica]